VKALLILPFTVIVIIPAVLIRLTGGLQADWDLSTASRGWLIAAGLVLLTAGFGLATATVKLFLTVGEGTPAPWDPS